MLQAITSHRSDGEPLALEAGILRVADALDMAKGRSRIPFEAGSVSMHSLSAAAIEEVTIEDGDEKPVKIGILMNNSSGLFQVDGLLKAKLRGSGLEPYVEVIAHIDTENEKRLVSVYRARRLSAPGARGRRAREARLLPSRPIPAGSSNGRTPDSGSGSWGSSPCPAARRSRPHKGAFSLFVPTTLVTANPRIL